MEFFKDSENEKVLYKKEDKLFMMSMMKVILNWLVSKSNEYDMEPLMTKAWSMSVKNFNPSV